MVFGTAVDPGKPPLVFALCIGGAVGISVLAFGPISGAALNPVRWLGPALISAITCKCDRLGTKGLPIQGDELAACNDLCNALAQFWIYLGGPMIGGVLAAFVYNLLLLKKAEAPAMQEIEEEKDESNFEETGLANETEVENE